MGEIAAGQGQDELEPVDLQSGHIDNGDQQPENGRKKANRKRPGPGSKQIGFQ